MLLNVKQGYIEEDPADLILVGVFEDISKPEGVAGHMDRALGGLIKNVIANRDFKATLNSTLVLYPSGEGGPRRAMLVGLGQSDKFGPEQARQVAATAARQARGLGVKAFATTVHGLGKVAISAHDLAQAVVEGTLLGLYEFLDYKQLDENRHTIEEVNIFEANAVNVEPIQQGAHLGRLIAEGQMLARDLSNQPGNVATPTYLAEAARKVGEQHHLKVTVLETSECQALGMGLFTGVAQGSQEPAKFIAMDYDPGHADVPTVVLIGKGITFDSGGINLKPTDGMWNMKHDMSGGAAVIGALPVVGALQLPLRVVGIVPATENLPSGTAFKPGDILRAMNSKTIEIQNTDAEGRLVLGDALCYAARYQPQGVIDLATLTGACKIALGPFAAGLMTNDLALSGKVKLAGEKTGERVWELPLWDEYNDLVKSTFADIKNTGSPKGGGAITAAAILQNFVAGFPWVHLDIAGVATSDDEQGYTTKGATGFGVRLCVEVLRSWT